MRNRSIKLHKINGTSIDDTGFNRFEVTIESAKVNKCHIDQHPIWKESSVKAGGLGSVVLGCVAGID